MGNLLTIWNGVCGAVSASYTFVTVNAGNAITAVGTWAQAVGTKAFGG